MNELTFLEIDQIFGDKALDIFKKRGTTAAITDFAILLGGFVNPYHHVDGYRSLSKRTGFYWTKTDDNDNGVRVAGDDGSKFSNDVSPRNGGFRIATSIPDNINIDYEKNGVYEIEYGYYPRSAVSEKSQIALERLYNYKSLKTTGNTYTTDSRKNTETDKLFMPRSHVEYEYNNKKYLRVQANTGDKTFLLSNGIKYKRGDYVWIEVEPIKWLVDKNSKIMITEELIFSGVQFNHEDNYKGDFSKTDIKKFINTYLSTELFQNSNTININVNINAETSKIINNLYLKGYTKEQILTIAQNILNQMLKNTPPDKIDVKQKLKTPNK